MDVVFLFETWSIGVLGFVCFLCFLSEMGSLMHCDCDCDFHLHLHLHYIVEYMIEPIHLV